VPGNHDYYTPAALGYYGYFGDLATPREPGCTQNCQGYYAYGLGSWRIYALNSEVDMSAGSAQEQWLRVELAAHPASCILAYWHQPRFSSGSHGGSVRAAAIWQVLAAAGADVVLVGHDHHYERFAPQTPDGAPDPYTGMRQFIVGTGGVGLREVEEAADNSEVIADDTWGVLKLTLDTDRYAWEFVPIAGQSFTDQGEGSCIGVTETMLHRLYVPVLTGKSAPGGAE
jgi:hypothetical protein